MNKNHKRVKAANLSLKIAELVLDFEEFDRINEAIETLKGQPGVQEPPIKAGGTM